MGRTKLKKPSHQPFEGKNRTGLFFKITNEMVSSPAWRDLSLEARGLYVEFKAKYRQRVDDGKVVSCNVDDISMPVSEYSAFCGQRKFERTRDELISHGFIQLLKRQKYMGQPNIFGLSDEWQNWRAPPRKH